MDAAGAAAREGVSIREYTMPDKGIHTLGVGLWVYLCIGESEHQYHNASLNEKHTCPGFSLEGEGGIAEDPIP